MSVGQYALRTSPSGLDRWEEARELMSAPEAAGEGFAMSSCVLCTWKRLRTGTHLLFHVCMIFVQPFLHCFKGWHGRAFVASSTQEGANACFPLSSTNQILIQHLILFLQLSFLVSEFGSDGDLEQIRPTSFRRRVPILVLLGVCSKLKRRRPSPDSESCIKNCGQHRSVTEEWVGSSRQAESDTHNDFHQAVFRETHVYPEAPAASQYVTPFAIVEVPSPSFQKRFHLRPDLFKLVRIVGVREPKQIRTILPVETLLRALEEHSHVRPASTWCTLDRRHREGSASLH